MNTPGGTVDTVPATSCGVLSEAGGYILQSELRSSTGSFGHVSCVTQPCIPSYQVQGFEEAVGRIPPSTSEVLELSAGKRANPPLALGKARLFLRALLSG